MLYQLSHCRISAFCAAKLRLLLEFCNNLSNFVVRMNELPKILLLGDYSNCHQALSTGLRALGCDVTVASDGTKWMQCDRNVDITRPDGKLGGLFHYM
ncbi:MAG: hypothetical protein K2F96_00645, partial [Muribaculaceae bacterium]|nr:hypothetical protein [Muribaculaceae bacterium]